MNRFVHQVISSITIVGYFLVVTWGPAWHDHHHHGHSHSHCAEAHPVAESEAGHSHGHCCSHHQPTCCSPEEAAPAQTTPAHAPCHSPLHDDDCVVCQTLAHLPLAAPAIELVDAGEPVPGRAEPVATLMARLVSPVYDSRGPPLV